MRSHLDLELPKPLCPGQPGHKELELLHLLAFGPDSVAEVTSFRRAVEMQEVVSLIGCEELDLLSLRPLSVMPHLPDDYLGCILPRGLLYHWKGRRGEERRVRKVNSSVFIWEDSSQGH